MKKRALLIGGIMGLLPLSTAAQTGQGYRPLAPIPGVTDKVVDLGSFFNSLFGLTLTVLAILAVIMIAWGGIKYMTTESIDGKGEARGRITDAIIGLVLALLVYLILYVINPNLLKLNIKPAALNIQGQQFDTAAVPTGTKVLSSQEIDAKIEEGKKTTPGGGLPSQTAESRLAEMAKVLGDKAGLITTGLKGVDVQKACKEAGYSRSLDRAKNLNEPERQTVLCVK